MLSAPRSFDGMEVHVRGDGPAVLWVHGYTMDSTLWVPLWDLLPGWTHVGVDLPGHGGSRPFQPGEGQRELAISLARLADQAGCAHIVGMSFGSMIALQVAMEKARPFASVSLGSPALGGGPTDRDAAAQNRKLMQLYKDRGCGPWMEELWLSSPPDIFKGVATRPAIFEQVRAVVRRHRWTELADAALDRFARWPQTPQMLAKLVSRVLVLVGEHDMPAFKRSAELIRRHAPQGDRVYIPDCGHLPLIERPDESAACLLKTWSRVGTT